jgi:hypothetical protein
MERRSSSYAPGFAQKHALTRRRFMIGLGTAAATTCLVPKTAAAQGAATATPSADQQRFDQLAALSKELCGGGEFAAAETSALLNLLDSDAKLRQGLDELLTMPTEELLAATPSPSSANAQAASRAILLFWYTGSFNGDPITDRAADYTQLLAWQAMYTPAWTTCKLFGAWADAPTLTPQVPENS